MEVVLEVERLDLPGAIDAARRIWQSPAADRYVLDFAPLGWVEPFGMLYFASRLRAFREHHRSSRFQAKNFEKHGYAAYMGFFQSFGLHYGNDPGEAPGNLRYIPITAVPVAELRKEARARYQHVVLTVAQRCYGLAAVLTRNEGGDLENTLRYSLREILRNVIEHSHAETLWYAAQYWPAKGQVQLCVLDEGIGVRTSLSRNPNLKIQSDLDALRLALLPGISGVAFKGGPHLRRDEWANSGYGLFMTSQICAAGGSFLICSGEAGLFMENGSENLLEVSFPGTGLRLDINVREVKNLNDRLEDLHARGRLIAGELRQIENVTASVSSRMLGEDYPSRN